jgi:hypothetical protein
MSSAQAQANDAEKNIEIWKVKKLIKRLEAARGNGTSMISLIIRMFPTTLESGRVACFVANDYITAPKDQVSRAAKMLAEEFVSSLIVLLSFGKNRMANSETVGYCFQHQIACEPSFRAFGHYVHAAASQALQQGPSERLGRLLW